MTRGVSSTAASSSTVGADSAPRLNSLPPVADSRARVLVLGSMPGAASLLKQRYYAHPRNLFWPMMERHLGIDAAAPYAERLQALCDCGVALWDVLAACQRRGSLDGAIDRASERPNDVPDLLDKAPGIDTVLLNGARAATMFRRHLEATCLRRRPELRVLRLPSTSPANQSIPLAQREAAWAAVAEHERRLARD